MKKQLIYLPCERYKSRWTDYVSGPNGMFAECVRAEGVDLITIAEHDDVLEIRSGAVLDTVGRAKWSFNQVSTVLEMINDGRITSDSVVYVEDFWLPGMETIPYACTLKGIKPKVYAFCHAQSADPADFCFKMLPWIRYFEIGWAQWLIGIFVADEALKTMLIAAGICGPEKIHATGTVMKRQVLIDKFYPGLDKAQLTNLRNPVVLFTSRLDSEKRPDLFLQLADYYNQFDGEVVFRIISGRRISEAILKASADAGVQCLQEVSKQEYFAQLCSASVMVNTAVQDFVSYGLLDALAYGCQPLMPDWLTFPGVLQHDADYLYLNQNIVDAATKLKVLLERERSMYVDGDLVPDLYERFAQKYEGSVNRMLEVML